MQNFIFPYFSRDIAEFWRRWHISLSSWFRDYLFLPLAYSSTRKLTHKKYLGIRSDKIVYTIAITVTFLMCGFWHGAKWTYVLWGGIYCFYLVFAVWTKSFVNKFYDFLRLYKGSKPREFIDIIITFQLVSLSPGYFLNPIMFKIPFYIYQIFFRVLYFQFHKYFHFTFSSYSVYLLLLNGYKGKNSILYRLIMKIYHNGLGGSFTMQ